MLRVEVARRDQLQEGVDVGDEVGQRGHGRRGRVGAGVQVEHAEGELAVAAVDAAAVDSCDFAGAGGGHCGRGWEVGCEWVMNIGSLCCYVKRG